MKVLIIGRGGREHALAEAVRRSPLLTELYVAPGNPGMEPIATCIPIEETQIEALAEFALDKGINLTIVGPEIPLALGLVDLFQKKDLIVFGPTASAARIESSKQYAKDLMAGFSVPTAAYAYFDQKEGAEAYVEEKGAPIVIKENGLKAGKGVTVAMTLEEALHAVEEAFAGEHEGIVIEEFLEGFEFSLIAMVHEEKVYPLEVACDHKRAYDGDQGPNTGGMGAYSPSRRVTAAMVEDAMEKVMKPIAKALVQDGCPFTGFLYGGLIATAHGIKTIEFNARFGDPEAEVILPRLQSDLLEHILDTMKGEKPHLQWDAKTSLGVVLASCGYPGKTSCQGILPVIQGENLFVYHMGTEKKDDVLYAKGGRNLILVALEEDLPKAAEKVYAALEQVSTTSFFYRKDIGKKDLI